MPDRLLSHVRVASHRLVAGRHLIAGTLVGAAAAMAPADAHPQLRFTDVSRAAGVTGDVYHSRSAHSLGVNWIDVDNDGWVDLFAVGGDPDLRPRLFRNRGDGSFVPAHHLLPPLPAVEMSGSVFADYDNDGDQDIFVYTDRQEWSLHGSNMPDGPPNLLLQNQFVESGGRIPVFDPLFREVAATTRLDDLATPRHGSLPGHRTKGASWLDYNRDGCVDLFVGHTVMNAVHAAANRDRLFRNRCDGTFVDATAAAGLYTDDRPDYRAAFVTLGAHMNSDLWPDLYVINVSGDRGATSSHVDQIYHNRGGRFELAFANLPYIGDDAQAGMGIDVADIDRNGTWDLYISDLLENTPLEDPPHGNVLYLGEPDGGITENVATRHGIEGDDSWGVNFLDADHDGWEDLFVSSMLGSDFEMLYANRGDGTFENVADAAGMVTGDSRGSAVADYDGDGDLDIAVANHSLCANGSRPSCSLQLFRNDSPKNGNWIRFRLTGAVSNRSAIGVVVRVEVAGQTLMRQITGGSSHAQSELAVHFGLGPTSLIDVVRIDWPSGLHTRWEDQPIDRVVEVVEGSACDDAQRAACREAEAAPVR